MAYFENAIKNPRKTTQFFVHLGRKPSSLQPSWHLSKMRNGDAYLTDTSLCTGGELIQEQGSPLAHKKNLKRNEKAGYWQITLWESCLEKD